MLHCIIITLIFVCTNAHLNAITLSFDNLFPLTWYEKSVNALTYAWQAIDFYDVQKNDSSREKMMILDILISRCTVACFCIKKMSEHKQNIMHTDYIYLLSLMHSLQEKIALFLAESDEDEYSACLKHIIHTTNHYLQIPTNINAK